MASFNELIDQKNPVLVDFKADWCGPCKTMIPILKEVKKQLKDQVAIIKIDVDKNPAVAAKYEIRGVPTLMIFKESKQVWKQSGVVQANQLIEIINSFS
ncbi:MAG: thioredoxin [Aureibaculum sp.]|nr:thioredoxin [Aureibaculum sp.]